MTDESVDPGAAEPQPANAQGGPAATGPPSSIGLWERIRTHKVAQWTLAYAAAAYTLLHSVEMVANALDWPHLVVRVCTLLLLLGLPVATTLAWYHGHRKRHRVSGPELVILALLVVIAGGVLSFLARPVVERGPAATAPSAPATTGPASVMTATPPSKSIAVLPFVDISEKKDQEYFSDGLSEELIDLLTKVPDLRVPARTSSFYFKGKPATIAEIAKALNVANVLEGSVRKSGNTVRITAQLIRADNGYHVWSRTYDRNLKDIFRLQGEIAASVVQALKATLLQGTPRGELTSTNVEVYTLLLQGRFLNGRQTEADTRQAIAILERAVALDPSYAPAWAELSQARLFLAGSVDAVPEANVARARTASEKALALDPTNSAAYDALAHVKQVHDFDWQGAEAARAAALRADPATPRPDWVGLFSGCVAGPCYKALINDLSRIIDRDPLNAGAYANRGTVRYLAGDNLEAAERDIRYALELSPSLAYGHYALTQILIARHDLGQVLGTAQLAAAGLYRRTALALAYHALGRHVEADAALRDLLAQHAKGGAYQIAQAYGHRGDVADALNWLDIAYRQHDPGLATLKVDPAFAPLRAQPRFKALLRDMHLPE